MPKRDQITEILPFVRTNFLVTMSYNWTMAASIGLQIYSRNLIPFPFQVLQTKYYFQMNTVNKTSESENLVQKMQTKNRI